LVSSGFKSPDTLQEGVDIVSHTTQVAVK
jgi:hypothetical protein